MAAHEKKVKPLRLFTRAFGSECSWLCVVIMAVTCPRFAPWCDASIWRRHIMGLDRPSVVLS